jgi:hypothetical protein
MERIAYNEGLDLEDTLTARCAFAIEKFPERRVACRTWELRKLFNPKPSASGTRCVFARIRRSVGSIGFRYNRTFR